MKNVKYCSDADLLCNFASSKTTPHTCMKTEKCKHLMSKKKLDEFFYIDKFKIKS